MQIAILSFLACAAVVFAVLCWKYHGEAQRNFGEVQKLQGRYGHVIDADASVLAAKADLERIQRESDELKQSTYAQREKLNAEYQQALTTYQSLKREISLLEENLEDISFGLYKPHFTFQTSEGYKSALETCRNAQKEMVRNNLAATCLTKWTVGNSARDGERMTKQYLKLLLRCFNSECDAAVANVTWNNITKMEERIRKSFQTINTLGGVMQMSIGNSYLDLKLNELRLAHEYEDKCHQEREEQRLMREQIREEERAQREFEKAKEDAEKEEARYQKALEKARDEAMRATGVQLDKLTSQISSLESKGR